MSDGDSTPAVGKDASVEAGQRVRIAELETELTWAKEDNRGMFQYLVDRGEELERQFGVFIKSHPPDQSHAKQWFEVSYLCPKPFNTRVDALKFAERLMKVLKELRR